jgi:hypothetical protein
MAAPSPFQRPVPTPEVQAFAADTAAAFLTTLFRNTDSGFVVLHQIPSNHSQAFALNDPAWIRKATDVAMNVRHDQHVYQGVCVQSRHPERGSRGKSTDVSAVMGLWADIDIKSQHHAAENLPTTIAEAQRVIDSVPFPPTITVNSGYGLQPYWLFREPFEIANEDDRRAAAELIVAFQQYLRNTASRYNWTVDSTADLARILRLPGTFNIKGSTPILVSFTATDNEPRYNPSDFEEFLEYETDHSLLTPPAPVEGGHEIGADFARISNNCAWVRHCIADAATLPEPEWYRALAVTARCSGGRSLAHQISQAHSKYTAAETDKKFDQSLLQSRAPRCQYISNHFDPGGSMCGECVHYGRINSPVKLGIAAPARPAPVTDDGVARDEEAPEPAPASAANPHWRDMLLRSVSTEAPKGLLANAITAFRHSPAWDGVLAFNAFSLTTMAMKPPPWMELVAEYPRPWTDRDDCLAADWLQREHIEVRPDTAGQAAQAVAHDHEYHPVREWLADLKWDGQARVATWLNRYLGVPDDTYSRAVAEKWLVSAVARIHEPGAKADCVLILEGPQGLRKSTALNVLGYPWFTDQIPDLGSKESSIQIQGVWIVEIAELASINRSALDATKAFMSRATDRFRPPYGKRSIDAPRQCVFAGSVNPGGIGYLNDETGARRFWPVVCTGIDIDALQRDREQIWAEAVASYRSGVKWWMDTRDLELAAEQHQSDRYNDDVWDEMIRPWLERPVARRGIDGRDIEPFTSDRDSVTVVDVLVHCIGRPLDRCGQPEKARVGRSLTWIGWEKYRASGGAREWRYRRKGSEVF